jgi:FkbM family methyltransferase
MTWATKLEHYLPQFLRRHKIIYGLIRLFPSQRIQRFSFDDSEIIADLRFPEGREVFIKRRFTDHGYFALACEMLPQNGVHFDVGANFGFHTFGICRLLGHRAIQYHLFEPNSFCVDCHRLSVSLHDTTVFVINQMAMGSMEQNVELLFDAGHTGGGYIQGEVKTEPLKSLWRQKAHQGTLDNYLRNSGLGSVDFCKVDIEGSEPDFLLGASASLIDGTVRALYMEVNEGNLSRVGKKPSDLYAVLESFGFHLVFPHRKAEGTWAVYQGVSRALEFTDFSPNLADTQFDVLALHESSEIWKSRKKPACE